MNMTTVPSNQLKAMQHQLAAQELVIQQLRDALDFIDSENASEEVLRRALQVLALQPSPEILEARDERVAEACAKVAAPKVGISHDDYSLTIRNGTVKALRSGAWKEYL